ncbi:hypothetical protein HMSSN036_67500 [Paenibacillus macerans]|nr:hypothetical protein HMSSN036_67500 [Paenibacillus macerans]
MVSTEGPTHGKLQELNNLSQLVRNFNLIGEIEFSGNSIDTFRRLFGLPNIMKMNVSYINGNPLPFLNATYDIAKTIGSITFYFINITLSQSNFDLSTMVYIPIGDDAFFIQWGFQFYKLKLFWSYIKTHRGSNKK